MNSSIQQLLNQYQHLRSLVASRQISNEQFHAEVQRLRVQDEQGTWWTVNPASGNLMRYDGRGWVAAPIPSPSQASAPRSKSTSGQKIVPFLGLIVSFACGGMWALYTMLRIGEGEPVDLLTPIIMVALPLCLWIFSKAIDKTFDPMYIARDRFPRPLLIGAALALPFVLGIFLSAFNSSGYGAMRWTAFLSIVGAYLLTRKRQVYS